MENITYKSNDPFTMTSNQLLNSKNISLKAKGLYSFMKGKPDGWRFTIKSMVSQLKEGEDSISSALKELRNFGWINYRKKSNGYGEYFINNYPKLDFPDLEKSQNGKTPEWENPKMGKPRCISNKDIISNKENNNNKENNSLFSKNQIENLPEKILDYLNLIKPSKNNFKPSSSNLKNIKARIKEKNKFEDFKLVIDFKVSQWKDNEKMKKYIRPSTLFGDKFDLYLVEAKDNDGNAVLSVDNGSNNFKLYSDEENTML